MANLLPVLTAVGSGAFDSVENVFINVASKIPVLNSLARNKELDKCLSGKVHLVAKAVVLRDI